MLKNKLIFLIPLIVSLLANVLIGGCGLNKGRPMDTYDSLRDKWKTFLTGGSSYNLSDPDISTQIKRITQKAGDGSHWAKINKQQEREYLWKDLTDWTQSATVGTSYRRLNEMALAYATTGSSLKGDPALRDDIISALEWLYEHKYNENTVAYDNWWWWQIGIPKDLDDICVLLYNDLSPAQIQKYMGAVKHFTPIATGSTSYDTGANRIDKAQAVAIRGILEKDSAAIANARDALSDVFLYVNSGEGFYPDGSFIQHTNIPYTLSYGNVLIQGMANLIYLLNSTTWAVKDPNMSNLYKWTYDSFAPLIYKGAAMDMVRGRAISRSSLQDHVAGHQTIQAILQISQFAPPADAVKLKSMVKGWLTEDTYLSPYDGLSIYLIQQLKVVLNDPTIKPSTDLVEQKQYPNMDRVVHLRPDFGFGLSLFSSRIQSYETMNGENLHGWFTSSGMTYLYNSDLGQYSGGYWATVDPYRLAGTTVDRMPMKDGVPYKYKSGQSWVGGTSIDGLYGTAGMQLEQYNSPLAAKKSWFLFDDEIVALGSGISSADSNTIETTIDNRKLSIEGDNPLTVNGQSYPVASGWNQVMPDVKWINLQGNSKNSNIGYYFPTPATVHGLREVRTAEWSTINNSEPSSQISNHFLTLWFDHGKNPVNAHYAYVILPNKTDAELNAYASDPDVVILENSLDAQGVTEKKLNITGVNFWNDAAKTVGFITSNKKAAVITHEPSSDKLKVSVSDPTMLNNGTIEIELNKSAASLLSSDSNIKVTQLSPTIKVSVSVKGAQGRSFTAAFALQN
ncbi:MAG: hypothetical protein JWN30_1812 [Bacilli bacterium]|nr:hypothetical protein [Bacilli bacterium]